MKKYYTTTAVWSESHYNHFGIHKMVASIYGDDPNDIETLKIKISDDQTIPKPNSKYNDADYWGWLPNDEEEFNMIYPQRFLLDMCFPAGIIGTERAGQGKAYRLEIVKK